MRAWTNDDIILRQKYNIKSITYYNYWIMFWIASIGRYKKMNEKYIVLDKHCFKNKVIIYWKFYQKYNSSFFYDDLIIQKKKEIFSRYPIESNVNVISRKIYRPRSNTIESKQRLRSCYGTFKKIFHLESTFIDYQPPPIDPVALWHIPHNRATRSIAGSDFVR